MPNDIHPRPVNGLRTLILFVAIAGATAASAWYFQAALFQPPLRTEPSLTNGPSTDSAPADMPRAATGSTRTPASTPAPTNSIGVKLVPPAPDFTNAIGMKLVLIPAGKFSMGSKLVTTDDRHEVEISAPFYMGCYEVTQQEYTAVLHRNPSSYSADGINRASVAHLDNRRFPVESVSWNDAVEFCRRLSALPEEKAAGRVYRLPTEAEWEYACRAGTTTTFHFGERLGLAHANCRTSYPENVELKGRPGRPTPVGSYPPNAFGLYDMHGNIWEWCADWYATYPAGPQKDPRGPSTGMFRVVRGGSWSIDSTFCHSAARWMIVPSDSFLDRLSIFGFRVVVPTR